MSITELIKEFEEIAAMRSALKERSMIYMADAKEEAAEYWGRPRNYFYKLSYRNWCRISRLTMRSQEKKENDTRTTGSNFAANGK